MCWPGCEGLLLMMIPRSMEQSKLSHRKSGHLVVALRRPLVHGGEERLRERRGTLITASPSRADPARAGQHAIDEPEQVGSRAGHGSMHPRGNFERDGEHDFCRAATTGSHDLPGSTI